MEVKIGTSEGEGAIVYISDDCLVEYGVPETRLPVSVEEPLEEPLQTAAARKKRAAENSRKKCYSWNSVLLPSAPIL